MICKENNKNHRQEFLGVLGVSIWKVSEIWNVCIGGRYHSYRLSVRLRTSCIWVLQTLSGVGPPWRQRRENGERTENKTTTLQYVFPMCVIEYVDHHSALTATNALIPIIISSSSSSSSYTHTHARSHARTHACNSVWLRLSSDPIFPIFSYRFCLVLVRRKYHDSAMHM